LERSRGVDVEISEKVRPLLPHAVPRRGYVEAPEGARSFRWVKAPIGAELTAVTSGSGRWSTSLCASAQPAAAR
jgi:hypothetical protein